MKELDELRIAFIGAGKVGFSLGKFFAEGGVHVTGFYSRHVESARQAAEFTGSTIYEDLKSLVADNDVIFLTVPDGEIRSVYDQIKVFDIRNRFICHCSGSMTAGETFPDIEQYGASGYSIHPLFPVSSKLTSYKELSGAFFCLEGTSDEVEIFGRFLKPRVKGVRIIANENKTKYHAAAVVASNLYCSLMKLSLELLEDSGFTEDEAITALAPLVRSNMEHILSVGPVKALTGPVERGDFNTVKKHLAALKSRTLEGKESSTLESKALATSESSTLKSIALENKARGDYDLYLAATNKLIDMAKDKNPERDYSSFDTLKSRIGD